MFFVNKQWILGQNERNLLISQLNKKEDKIFADSKIKTKQFFLSHEIPVPSVIAYIRNTKKAHDFDIESLTPPFVIKPNAGAGGKWILVIQDRIGDIFYTISGKGYSKNELRKHLIQITQWYFSVAGWRDSVLIEEKIFFDSSVELLSKYGLPDIRVIVYNYIPIMAMIRIPTKSSGWKANIHQGAAGGAIDLGTGKISKVMIYNRLVKIIPWIGDIRWVKIPHWEKVLEVASRCQFFTNIPYLACDIALDDRHGPMVLELNVRPGLFVQNVNQAALAARIRKVQDISVNSIEKGVRLGMDIFSFQKEKKENSLPKKILGLYEYFYFETIRRAHTYVARIKPDRSDSYISQPMYEKIKKELGYSVKTWEERGETCIEIIGKILDISKTIVFHVRSLGDAPFSDIQTIESIKPAFIIGGNDLGNMLIDPYKYKEAQLPDNSHKKTVFERNREIINNQEKKLYEIDVKMVNLERKLRFGVLVQPRGINFIKEDFIMNKWDISHSFEYGIDGEKISNFMKEVEKISFPDIPFLEIYKKKQEESLLKWELLLSIISWSDKKTSQISKNIYGDFVSENISESYKKMDILLKNSSYTQSSDILSFSEIENIIKKFIHIYGLQLKVIFTDKIMARCAIGKKSIRIRNDIQITRKELRALIAHEIETHFLRRINGISSGLAIFEQGTSGYLEIEEWIAIENQLRFLSADMTKSYSFYRIYAVMDYARSHSYIELLSYLEYIHKWDWEKIFYNLIRLRRGMQSIQSSFLSYKDIVYLNGYKKLQAFLNNWWDIRELYFWKIHIDDVEIIKENISFIKIQHPQYPIFME